MLTVYSAPIKVKDVDAALDFYVNVLGFEKVDDADMGEFRFVTVRPQGAATSLSLDQANGDRAEPAHTGITLSSTDLERTYADLTAKGVTFEGPLFDTPWGAKGGEFRDLDGNIFFISEAKKA